MNFYRRDVGKSSRVGVVAWWNPTDLGIRVTIRVSPGARKTALTQVGPDGLRIRLAARPVEGQANAELVGFVAQLFGVRRSAVHLVRGDRSRIKTLEIDGLTEPPSHITNLR